MRFTKLRILGFKSFVEPTEFLIERGLTGVVGPNGCGKSNLVEAIKWVMGESSYKNMRASGMDDVIFSGSGNRPARNTAEVTLVIDNTDRTAPAAFNDNDTIEITRRIERDSGSVYRINGKESRAKDVQLLFADASTGARSPSMVGQGRIGELIAAKPRQRRAILEEAAGISGLHSRRHEAELRLKAADQNLDRVEDVISQLESQLESLKRQARQANRYRNLSGEIRKFEATVYYLRFKAATEALLEAEKELTGFSSAVADATSLQAKTARDQAVTANALPDLRDKAGAAGAALQRLQVEQGNLEQEEARAKARISELSNRVKQLESDMAREKALLSDNKAIFERLAEEEKQLKSDDAASSDTKTNAEKALADAREKQEMSEQAFNATTKEIAELNARRTGLQNSVQQAEQTIARLRSNRDKVAADIADVDEQMNQDLFINSAQKTLEDAQEAVAKTEAQIGDCEQKTQAARDNEVEAKTSVVSLDRELNALQTEAKTLSNVLNMGSSNAREKLIDQLRAEPGFEIALGAALGEDLDVAIDRNSAVHWAGAEMKGDDPALPEGATPLADFVAAPDLIARRLNQIGIVDAERANELARELKAGQRLVTRDGALWRWDGLIASADAETPAAQRLAQKNRLDDLEGAIIDKQKQVNIQKEKLQEAADTLGSTIQNERALRQRQKELIGAVNKARDALAKIENEASRLAERKNSLEERNARLAAELETSEANLQSQKSQLYDVPNSDALNERLQKEQTMLANNRASLAEARAAFETLSREADMRKRRLASIENERQSWVSRVNAAEKQIEVLTERKEKTLAEQKKLEDAPAEIARHRASLFGKLEEFESAKKAADANLAEAEKSLRDADEAAKQALSALSEIREARVRAEGKVESAKTRKQDLSREIAESLDCAPGALGHMADLKDGTPLPETKSVETRLDRLKAERERLGGVNLRAEQEMEEIGTKRDELINERDDLIEAIRQLRVAIASLNKEGRERLLSAFDEVNAHFKHLFTHLFGGGTAELQLTESDDPLEAGLDIIARPPGKKPQTMTLLSGGEQALTAMALIFAVFLTNPAPICVLDEVDAPLDDANVERYCNLLEDMIGTTDTRFLTITHNPITMARMNRLFGVTMAERGVSQLVSVDLETAASYREAG